MAKSAPFNLDTIVNNPVTKKQLESFIEEIVLHRSKMKTHQLGIKDILVDAKNSIGIPPRVLNGLIAEKINPGTIDQQQHDIEEISDLAVGLGIKE
jgi:Ni,Fe-hydrogenase maturation factor